MKRSNAVDVQSWMRNSLISAHRAPEFFLSTLLAAFLAGCMPNVNPLTYTDAALPDPHKEPSAIDFARDLKRTTATLLDKVLASRPSPAEEKPDYLYWSTWWCPRHREVNSPPTVQQQMTRYCQEIGGTVMRNACVSATDENDVKFYAIASVYGNCGQVANPVGLRIYEPKPGQSKSPGYLAAIHEDGYRSASDVAVERGEQKLRVQSEQERKERELPLLRTRGTRVCNNQQNGQVFRGFVEDVSGQKIRISVQEAYYTDLLGIKGLGRKSDNYQPQMVWDMPQNWYVCE